MAMGVEWMSRAVVFFAAGGEAVAVFPECRGYGDARRNRVRMEMLTVADIVLGKAAEELVRIEGKLKQRVNAAERRRLEQSRVRLLRKVESREGGMKGVMKIREILGRMATVMQMYLPAEVTGLPHGQAVAEATGRTKAAVSAQKITLLNQDTKATGGQVGFAGMRKRRGKM